MPCGPRGLALLVVSTLLFEAPPARGQVAGPSPAPDNVIEQFDIFTDGDLLLVPVRLGPKVVKLAVDTGASVTMYDRSLRAHLGPVRGMANGHMPDGIRAVEYFDAPEASLGRLSLRTTAPVACLDLGVLRQESGHDLFGLVGMSFLKDRVIRLDFDGGKLSILKAPGPAPGTPIPLSFQRDNPFVPVSIPRAGSLNFMVDTGWAGVVAGGLDREDARRLLDHGSAIAEGNALNRGISREYWDLRVRLPELSVHNFINHQILMSVGDDRFPSRLGLGFLKQYDVTFDFPGRKMYLRPGRQFDRRGDVNRSGLGLTCRGGMIVIVWVVPGPGMWAGIRAGDVLLKVDGSDVARLRRHSVLLKVRAPEAPVRLTLRRGEQTFEVRLEPLKPQAAPRQAVVGRSPRP